jgi:hypothetical protein
MEFYGDKNLQNAFLWRGRKGRGPMLQIFYGKLKIPSKYEQRHSVRPNSSFLRLVIPAL